MLFATETQFGDEEGPKFGAQVHVYDHSDGADGNGATQRGQYLIVKEDENLINEGVRAYLKSEVIEDAPLPTEFKQYLTNLPVASEVVAPGLYSSDPRNVDTILENVVHESSMA